VYGIFLGKRSCRSFDQFFNSETKRIYTRIKRMLPLLKWVGGKRRLSNTIVKLMPSNIKQLLYYEPFLGGGAVFFNLKPDTAVINDINEELINVYLCIKNNPKELIESLKKHKNTAEYFYEIRALDREPNFFMLSDIKRASRFIYLNKTCFGGMYRVNKLGYMNSAFANYDSPIICDEDSIFRMHEYLNSYDIVIKNDDYKKVLDNLPADSFVYLDPPYFGEDKKFFTGYTLTGWSREEQLKLCDICSKLHQRKIKFILSNSNTDFIKELFKDYNMHKVHLQKAIARLSHSKIGNSAEELLIMNY
ncbi:MAG: DNA adenine methylase, partial [Oscillospiraceae bacterium]